jgi:hypothetical protein
MRGAGVTDVRMRDDGATAELAYVGRNGLGGLFVHVEDADVGALLRESKCNRPADALPAPVTIAT